jgi:cation transporter-like permease
MTATLIETKALLETVVYSLVAGVGLTVIFSLAVWGVTRFSEFNRDERPIAAGGAAALSLLALAATLGAVVFGIVLTTKK